jgi:FMN phosphatase YigB (HAD superfamily)
VREVRVDRLAALLPELERDGAARLLDDLRAGGRAARDRLDQRTDAMVAERLASIDPALAGRAADVRRALGRPTGHERPPFPGHRDLMLTAGELGMRRVLVTNTNWISDDDWTRWWLAARDMDGVVEGVVTSYSLGWRKPHPAMFDRAMSIAGCPARACVYAGDKEAKDVAPAVALGMTVIQVAIDEPPSETRAHHQVTSLAEAIRVLRDLSGPLTNH